jgi:hypothetical protein
MDLATAADQFIDEASTASNVELVLESAFRLLCSRIGRTHEAAGQQSYTVTENQLTELHQSLRLAYHLTAIGEQAQRIQFINQRVGGQING